MTEQREDYLEIIYDLCERNEKATHKDICQKTGNSGSSVSEMIKKLKKAGYVYVEDNGIYLTDEGNAITKKIISKHRLWESFLHDYLKIPWEKVDQYAHKLEHDTDEYLMGQLNEFLGLPKFCPHGGIIFENFQGEIQSKLLSDCVEREEVIIASIYDDKELLIYLKEKNISLGDKVVVKKKNNFDMSVEIEHKGKTMEFSKKVSESIHVKK